MNYFNSYLTCSAFFINLSDSFRKTFIYQDRWKQLLKGLGVTLQITVFAAVIGIIIGFIVAAVRSTYDKNLQGKKCRKLSDYLLKFFNGLCNVYLTVIRGTPVVVQLMIIHFIVLASVRNGIYAAIVAFGVNSGAYVAEIVRSGIMSIDKGQFEAGKVLGLSYFQTMKLIILPQSVKRLIPPVGNEFIMMLKDASLVSLIALSDITKVTRSIQSSTASSLVYIPAMILYLIITAAFTLIFHLLEKKNSVYE